MNKRSPFYDLESEPAIPADMSHLTGSFSPGGVIRCSFCNLGEGEVARLFEGYAGYICDECVDVCTQIQLDFEDMGFAQPKTNRPWYKKLFVQEDEEDSICSFNLHDRNNPQGDRLFPGNDAKICDKCVRACEVLKSTLVIEG